ncbi:GNAT family N-acetyltransferase [Martelella alba]|uniref:GNAT family N-acetyltransferase n=1 Tax=Martelella alba TaxID=2590451 RepID=A0ABY2SLW4_9HYPH|nr:GNAT family N-acetyltransferase [Martelella alba]TKI06730.1 GNAT family N-acetyltransferase [Martelella alba]
MIEIRQFNPADQNGVIDVILPIQQREFGIAITAEDQPDLRDIPGFYQNGKGGFWVALYQNTVVGTLGLKDIGDDQGALRKMFVSAAYRGSQYQVAAQLLDALLLHASRRRIRGIFLGTTDKFLAAHRFYRKHGFAELPKTALPAGFPIMAVDSLFFSKSL